MHACAESTSALQDACIVAYSMLQFSDDIQKADQWHIGGSEVWEVNSFGVRMQQCSKITCQVCYNKICKWYVLSFVLLAL